MYVENLGPGDVGTFSVGIYYSCPQGSNSVSYVDVSGLAAGAEKFIRVKFTFDSIGDCVVGATIDSDNVVAESNEDNNDISVAVTSQ